MIVFHLIISRYQTSTHFPYTTLFRSSLAGSPGDRCTMRKTRMLTPSSTGMSMKIRRNTYEATALPPQACNGASDEDRKSTRLNSSHVKISYAVFCLKKKKNDITYIHI